MRRGIVGAEIGLGLDDAARGATSAFTKRAPGRSRGRRRPSAARRTRAPGGRPAQASSSARRRCRRDLLLRGRQAPTLDLDHLFWSLGDERLVAELGLRPVAFGHGRGDLLAQPVPLGVEIDHPRQGQHGDDVAGHGGERALTALGCHPSMTSSSSAMRQRIPSSRRAVSKAAARPAKISAAIQRPGSTRFGAGVANGAHGLDQGAEVRLGSLVPGSGFGPGGDHHALPEVWQLLPQRLGDERHEGMQETDGALHGVGECLCDSLSLGGGATLPHLGRFDVPVTEFGPDELANRLSRLAVLVRLHQAVGVLDGGVQATEDPAVGQGELAAGARGRHRP